MTQLRTPTAEQLMDAMMDIAEPKHGVQVDTNEDRSVLWVNVDGVCVLRICRIPDLHVNMVRG